MQRFLLLWLCVGCAFTAITPPTQTQALIKFYEATNGQNWLRKENWLQSDQPCSPNWFGVTCDSDHNIVSLKLPKNNLVGSLPETLCQLQYLNTL